MLLTKSIKIKVTSNMCKYYRDKGYIFNCNDVIEVDISDLPPQSNYRVLVKCECCGKEYYMPYYTFYKCGGVVCCKSCKYSKIKETNIKKYGVPNVFQNKDIQDKQKQTVSNKYGVNNVFANKEVQEKIKNTIHDKYGVYNVMQNKEIAQKSYNKMCETKLINNSQVCSRQQKHIKDVLGGTLNYPFSNFWLDVYFDEEKIYLEYNGSGHDINVKYGKITQEQFSINEIKRYKILKQFGLKQIVVSSQKDILPEDDILLSLKCFAFFILKNNISNWIVFDIDKNIIRYKNNSINCQYNTPIDINNLIVTTVEDNICKDENTV